MMGQSPGEIKSREVELDSHSCMDCLAAEFFLNSCFLDTVFVDLFCTTVETADSGIHKLLCIGGVPTSLTVLFWWWLTDSSGLYWSELWEELLIGTQQPPFSCP